MTAEEYLALGETAERYELVDGVVVLSPSPRPPHNELTMEIGYQLKAFAARAGIRLRVFPETDLLLARGNVYRPDLAVYLADRLKGRPAKLELPPDLVVEVLSAGSKVFDYITKRDDYERFGVGEYWVVDPDDASIKCWRRQGDRLLEGAADSDTLACASISGFVLDLPSLRRVARGE